MILKEEEAKKLLCDQTFNNEIANDYDNRCISSECMQWVWHDQQKKTGYCGRNFAHAMQRYRVIS